MFIVLEGLDRVGKSTIADNYRKLGYQVVHMSAPDKKFFREGYVGPSYLDELVDLFMQYDGVDTVFDRSHYGESIWPLVYNRRAMLSDDDIAVLRDFEDKNNTIRLLLVDDDFEAHWRRCVANKEPLTRSQFEHANRLYREMAAANDFTITTMHRWLDKIPKEPDIVVEIPQTAHIEHPVDIVVERHQPKQVMTPEQVRLAKANAIDRILSKRIVKHTGDLFDAIEEEIRVFLNGRLAEMLGTTQEGSFTAEEIALLKMMCEGIRAKQKKG